MTHPLAIVGLCALIGLAAGWLAAGAGGALLAGVGGAILGWGILKGAVIAGFRGAILGAAFLLLAGPGADWLVSWLRGREPHFDAATAHKAVVIGLLVGGLLGVRNFRRRKRTQ